MNATTSFLFLFLLVFEASCQINVDSIPPPPMPSGDTKMWYDLRRDLSQSLDSDDSMLVRKTIDFLSVDSEITNRKVQHIAIKLTSKPSQLILEFMIDNLAINYDNIKVAETDFGYFKYSNYPFFHVLSEKIQEPDVLKNFVYLLVESDFLADCSFAADELYLIKLLLHKIPAIRFLQIRESPGLPDCSIRTLRFLLDDDWDDVPSDLQNGKINLVSKDVLQPEYKDR
ncbi:MAG: hypothetical protein KTR24_18455 [Saprospiraceae bacterium]|nr:hypothetical protein [Saprospiraceae bacterium]